MRDVVESVTCAAIWYKDIPLKKVMPGTLPVNCDRGWWYVVTDTAIA